MILFVVNTVSQLVNAIVIANTEYSGVKCDLYYKDKLYVKHKTLCHEMFNKCYPYPKLEENNHGLINKVRKTIAYKELNNNINVDYNDYEKIFISSKSILLIQIYYAAKLINPRLELNLYEEGAFEYCELEDRIHVGELLYSFLVYHRYYLSDCKALYVYKPNLIRSRWKNISVKKITDLYDTGVVIERLMDEFGRNSALLNVPKHSIIFFDQEDDERLDEFQKDIIVKISKIICPNRIFIKLHPRSQKQKYGNTINYINNSSPFEFSIGDEKLEDVIFLTICSSAAINISLMSDKKPIIIYLYNIYDFKDRTNYCLNNFINRNLISEKSNIFAPLTQMELEEIIRRFAVNGE